MLAGGYSGEKEVSYKTAAFVMKHMDQERFTPYLIRVTEESWALEYEGEEYALDLTDMSCEVAGERLIFDLAFIAVHGTPGEDGRIQGYLDMVGIPYTTGGVLNTALTFNKYKTNELLRCWGMNVPGDVLVKKGEVLDEGAVLDEVGLPCFVKPNHGGSSLGNSKVTERKGLRSALDKAFTIDEEVLVEPLLNGREVACGVLRIDGKVTALPPIEIISHNDFFDYDAKYHSEATEEITPARIPEPQYGACLKLSERIYNALNCRGMVRIDFFLCGEEWYVVEVNTVPGLSDASLLPQEAEAYGLDFMEMISQVIGEGLGKG